MLGAELLRSGLHQPRRRGKGHGRGSGFEGDDVGRGRLDKTQMSSLLSSMGIPSKKPESKQQAGSKQIKQGMAIQAGKPRIPGKARQGMSRRATNIEPARLRRAERPFAAADAAGVSDRLQLCRARAPARRDLGALPLLD